MSSLPVPPRFVPTLTEIVHPALWPDARFIEANTPSVACSGREDLMVQRVLQRIDLILERRLQEAVGQLILNHTQILVLQLREEIEGVVRQSVVQAFEQEAAQ